MRFVLLLHETPAGAELTSHFDLMIDSDGTSPLRTWRLPLGDGHRPPEDCAADDLGAHRREYLSYQGDLTGGRGRVRRIDQGDILLTRSDADILEMHTFGSVLNGLYHVERSADGWRFRRVGDARRPGQQSETGP
jgi:hypothetical protein